MQLALECSTPLLDSVQPLTDFYFTLTHLVLSDPIYANYYRTHRDKMLILDNSTNELGKPCSIDDILKAADLINPDIVVPPDYLGDKDKTIDEVRIFLKVGWEDETKVLPVIQGKDIGDCYKCSGVYKNMGFKQVAVPYDICCSKEDSILEMAYNRNRLVIGLVAHFDWVHLLGLTMLEEIAVYKRLASEKREGWLGGCRFSIDTGSPIMHGLRGIRFGRDKLLDKKQPTLDRMNGSGNLEDVFYNISWLRKETNGI